MRILMIAPGPIPVPPPHGGSVEISMLAVARQLASCHEVILISRRFPDQADNETEGQLRLLRVEAAEKDQYLGQVLLAVAGETFDWIQVDNRPKHLAAVKSAFPSTPLILYLHSLTFVPKREDIAEDLAYADAIAVNSESLRGKMHVRFPQLAERIHTVALGVDANRFRTADGMEKMELRKPYKLGTRFTVLFAGRVIPRKGLAVLIRAMALAGRFKPAALLVAGSDGLSGYGLRIAELAKKHGVHVRFLGKLSHEAMPLVYGAADCFVCPSQRHEAFGLVNVEAMASGIPVVASAIGGIPEIIRDGENGLLVRSFRSAPAFAKSIRSLWQDPALAKRLGDQARRDAADYFSWERTASCLINLYESVKPVNPEKEWNDDAALCGQQVGQDESIAAIQETAAVYSADVAADEAKPDGDAE